MERRHRRRAYIHTLGVSGPLGAGLSWIDGIILPSPVYSWIDGAVRG